MKFRIGDKVKIKETLISKCDYFVAKILRSGGTIEKFSFNDAVIRFPKHIRYHIPLNCLKSTVNEQLLFEFMD